MSVASLENGNLTLSKLTITNSAYADVSGYIPSESDFSSNATTTYLNLANSLTMGGTLQLKNGTNAVNISNNGFSNVLIAGSLTTEAGITVNTGVVQLGQNANAVVLTGTTGNLSIAGGISSFGLTATDNGIRLTANGGTGVLNVNASNQLTWNGVVIS